MDRGNQLQGEQEFDAEPRVEDVLADWRQHLHEEIIPNLPDDCPWKWVALQLARSLRHSAPTQ
jgi:hypothetical protein